MAFKTMKNFPANPNRSLEGGPPVDHNEMSDLYSKGRLPIQRSHIGAAKGGNIHGHPMPGQLRSKQQDPQAQTQRFPFGGGSTPGSGGRAPSEPAEPPTTHGFDEKDF